MPKKKLIVMVVYGGVGEFLFQLDLARRFELENREVLFLVKSKYVFFCDIVRETNLKKVRLVNGKGWRYFTYIVYIWWLSLVQDVTIVNSFNSLFYRLPTKIFYNVAKFLSARIVVSKHDFDTTMLYEQVSYKKEMIWERNDRIVEYVCGVTNTKNKFPVIDFTFRVKSDVFLGEYVHIHPVGSSYKKSYPSKKLLEVLKCLVKENHILITMTPNEESWYITEEFRDFIAEHEDRVTLKSCFFSAQEIISYIRGSKVFCTVNTGILWFSIILRHKTIVFDTFTDYEWNPGPYKGITRLAHDYDMNGKSLHLVTKEHDDGVYFESMYLITSEEVCEAISDNFKDVE